MPVSPGVANLLRSESVELEHQIVLPGRQGVNLNKVGLLVPQTVNRTRPVKPGLRKQVKHRPVKSGECKQMKQHPVKYGIASKLSIAWSGTTGHKMVGYHRDTQSTA